MLGWYLCKALYCSAQQALDFWLDVVAIEDLASHSIDHFAVAVDDVIVLNNIFARIEVKAFDPLLRRLERLADRFVLNSHVFFYSKALHQASNALTLEDPHQVIFGRDVELGVAWVTLAATTAPQLVVDPARLMPLTADHHQAAKFLHPWPKLDVCTTPRDVRRQRHGTLLTSVRHNLGLTLIILSIEDLICNARFV